MLPVTVSHGALERGTLERLKARERLKLQGRSLTQIL
jgi:hypothetical protein